MGLGIDHMGRVLFWSLSAGAQDGVLKCRLRSSRGELKHSLRVGERLVCSQNQRSNNGLSTRGGLGVAMMMLSIVYSLMTI